MRNVLSLLFLSLLLGACSFVQNEDFTQANLKDKKFNIIYNQQELSFEEFISFLGDYDIILLGEKHDKYSHHLAQFFIIKALSEKGSLNVAFEMLSTDKQDIINKAKSNKQSVKPKDLSKVLEWEKGWKWEDYKGIVEFVFYNDIKLSAANISGSEIKSIYKGAKELDGVVSTKAKVKEDIKQIIATSHKLDINNAQNSTLLDKFVQIQQYKDRQMANTLTQSKQKAVLIAGACHTDKNIGVPLHIKDLKARKKVAVVIFDAYKAENCSNADFVWNFKR